MPKLQDLGPDADGCVPALLVLLDVQEVSRAMNGRELAELIASDYEKALALAYHWTLPDTELARDAVQATALNVLRSPVVEVQPERAWGYLYMALRNYVWDGWRKTGREVSLGERDWVETSPDPERLACCRETIEEVVALGTRCEKRDVRRLITGEYSSTTTERVNLSRLRAKARAAGLAPA